MNPTPLEIRPASPIELPQVEVCFSISQKWFNLITTHKIDVVHAVDKRVTGSPGRLHPKLDERFSMVFMKLTGTLEREIKAMEASDFECLKVSMTIRKDIWDLFEIAALNTGLASHHVLLTIIAAEIEWELESGARVRDLMNRSKADEAEKKASQPIAKGKVIPGEWKAKPANRRRSRTIGAGDEDPKNVSRGPWMQFV